MPSWAYCYLEAARTRLPFVPDKEDPPDAMYVGGPIFNYVSWPCILKMNNIKRVQANLAEYASVLWYEVLPRIGCTADFLNSVTENLIFNWMPGPGAIVAKLEFQNTNIKQVHILTKLGMLANAGMCGDSKIMVSLVNMSTVWIERAGEEWKRLPLWLSAEESWYRPVGGFVESIR
ncbi:uncharacterized protein N7446_000510 [Penicillium canescens]|uniref:uncharacterized protein n=1 Tax=Penicillium canescens TaxID=5083 RepID=UPI0026E05CBE|nr:uncharacterized protein N7446_000510 [Penicillium canescens]KAJ6077574.1 hypothetical protein N7446_000510 [Penicillium canescens]